MTYSQQQMKGQATPVLWQETSTLSQRLKSLESGLHGTHWTIARQLDLVKAEEIALAQHLESSEAARLARDDYQNRAPGTKPFGMTRQGEADFNAKGKQITCQATWRLSLYFFG